jgi:hypothetical protein
VNILNSLSGFNIHFMSEIVIYPDCKNLSNKTILMTRDFGQAKRIVVTTGANIPAKNGDLNVAYVRRIAAAISSLLETDGLSYQWLNTPSRNRYGMVFGEAVEDLR